MTNSFSASMSVIWARSPQFASDARYLWHAWWFPGFELIPSYGKGIGLLCGWKTVQLTERFRAWEKMGVIDSIWNENGGIKVRKEVYALFEVECANWKTDRATALDRVFGLLIANIDRNYVGGHVSETWTFDIIRYWSRLQVEGISCGAEATKLSLAAERAYGGVS